MGRLKGPSRERFEEVYSKGQRASGAAFRVSALPGNGLVGFATSRQIGDRPQRNRQRRRAVEAMRGQSVEGLDLTVMVKPAAKDRSLDELRKELGNLVMEVRARWAGGSESD